MTSPAVLTAGRGAPSGAPAFFQTKMRTVAYVEGINRYYGCLTGSRWKWLDLVALYEWVLQPHHEIVAAFRLLLPTGCRMSEIQFLRWEHIKDACIELTDAKTEGWIISLSPEARAVLADLPREDGNPWFLGRSRALISPISGALGSATANALSWRKCEFATRVTRMLQGRWP